MEKKTIVRRPLVGFLCTIGATLMWAVVPICTKRANPPLDAYTVCWLRIGIASPLLFLFSWWRGTLTPVRRRDMWLVFLAAMGIGWNYVLYILGLQYTTASAGNVVVEFEVIWMVILSCVWLKERMSGAKLIGVVLTFGGIFFALWNGEDLSALLSSKYFFGNTLILIGAPLWAVYGIAQKILADRGVSITASLAYIFGIAAIMTLPTVFVGHSVNGPITGSVVTALVVLVLFGTVASYLLLGKGLRNLEASTAGVITSLLPIFTIGAARVFLSEPLTKLVIAGAVLVVLGIGIIGHAEATSQPPI